MEDIRYLKVDLLVKPRDDLTSIVRVFGEDVAVFSNGKVDEFYYVYFKIAGNSAGPMKIFSIFAR